ncbi:OLC1v1004193C1 [Oldenlandia corymbosa var. corymbosa]|uniref:OLC1v1004193C1 n=1 Tax=Oldenlandia corymbosa var. corymbosa TaxID=529605 RepID=A0AAV1DE58_OLDCO|nr:OLC1v1004193C1 [Oldenlandia corymbosa var. corymbosa]
MEELGSLWGYEMVESFDELQQKLHSKTVELEQMKESMKKLMNMLTMACQERDEAKDLLRKILTKGMIPSGNQTELLSSLVQFQPDSPLLMPTTKANSSITESNSLSETYNYHSQNSSPGDCFFDNVSSPELSNMNMGDSSSIPYVKPSLIQDRKVPIIPNNNNNNNNIVPSGLPKPDHASLVIDSLAKGKDLPPKGMLLKSVIEAGPLLHNLLVAGPLPRWRNPPQLQTFNIPPVSLKGCEADIVKMKSKANIGPMASSTPMMNSRPYSEMSCASSQMLSTSVLNFAYGPSGSFLGSDRLISAGTNANCFVSLGKRQRF